MLMKDYIAKMYAEHPELPALIAEVERIYGDEVAYPDLVIPELLRGTSPEEIAANPVLMDL